ncbi:HTH-type transcriptional regulator DmlR [Pigmentiphaga humi]|uniref:HTH-type transcriptional regulator DmlR n=1 Tax=Pigmentiphaga humi TaxID=2478468 RepID=A0A3P4AZ08_9BURK|nr:LysR family transcriptional regulator [Pigmentiphaga humi]VCU68710.1 HTH-type transcriptional regulator DmlR [Pigmentiphaga humi]
MDRLTQLSLLVHIADCGSLRGAAAALQISHAAANRNLQALESRLQTRLLDRTGRRISLTGMGLEFSERARAILSDIDLAEEATHALSVQPRGRLRVSATHSFSTRHIAPLLREYAKQCPEVVVHIEVDNGYTDLIDKNIDVAIRTRDIEPNSSITMRRLAETDRVLAATPRYLARHGTPGSVADLLQHRILTYTHSSSPGELHFTRAGQVETVAPKNLLKASDSQILRTAALGHMGIVVQPTYVLYDELAAGRLVPVLQEWSLSPLAINLAFPSRKYRSGKVRGFVDCITAHFERMQYERRWNRFSADPSHGV